MALSLMATSVLFLILFCFRVTTAAYSNSGVALENCATILNVLEHALYETGDNVFEMNRNFYPPKTRASRFTEVSYTFLNEEGEDDGCNVTYYWAIGVTLLFQPPTLFQFNSLYFNYPNNNLTTVFLQLPHQCRPLVNVSSDGTCSCNADSPKLDILTQQLNIYGKYSDLANVEREDTFARAICSDHLYDTFYSGKPGFVYSILFITLFFPLMVLIMFMIIIRNMDDNTVKGFSNPSNHGNIVSIILVSSIITFSVLFFDIYACYIVYSGDHEFHEELSGLHTLNLDIAYGTLAINLIFIMPTIFAYAYICVINFSKCCGEDNTLENSISNTSKYCVCHSPIAWIIGTKAFNRIKKISEDKNIPVMFLYILFSSLMCFSSHISYILLAWLTEPVKCSTILILFYFLMAFFYLSFKKTYQNYAKIEFKCITIKKQESKLDISENDCHSCCLSPKNEIQDDNYVIKTRKCLICPIRTFTFESKKEDKDGNNLVEHRWLYNDKILHSTQKLENNGHGTFSKSIICCCMEIRKNKSNKSIFMEEHDASQKKDKESVNRQEPSEVSSQIDASQKKDEQDKESVNTQTCCFLFFLGFFFFGIATMMIAVLIILPLASEELANYLFSILQLTIIIISTQIAYELYFGSSFHMKDIVKKFREAYVKKHPDNKENEMAKVANDSTYDETDVVGKFGAELFEVVIKN